MKCLVNGLNTQWFIRENIIHSIINLLQREEEIPPLTIALLLQAFSEMHGTLELFGDDLPTVLFSNLSWCAIPRLTKILRTYP